jgi:hypothetical protein
MWGGMRLNWCHFVRFCSRCHEFTVLVSVNFFWSWWHTLERCIISLVVCSVLQDLSSRKYSETLSIKHSCSIFFFLFVFLSYLNHVWIFIWIMYFKVFGHLYCLFHFYFNCIILLFTTWLKLSIYNLLKYFSCDFTILRSEFILYISCRVKKTFLTTLLGSVRQWLGFVCMNNMFF